MIKEEDNSIEEEEGAVKEESDFAKLYEESITTIKEGQIVKGKIVAIRAKDVVIDIGYKSEGVVAISEFPDADNLKVGDETNVLVETVEDESGMVVVSKEKAERAVGWDMIIARYNEGDMLDGRVTRKVKGGFMADIGVEAFLPASLAAARNIGGM